MPLSTELLPCTFPGVRPVQRVYFSFKYLLGSYRASQVVGLSRRHSPPRRSEGAGAANSGYPQLGPREVSSCIFPHKKFCSALYARTLYRKKICFGASRPTLIRKKFAMALRASLRPPQRVVLWWFGTSADPIPIPWDPPRWWGTYLQSLEQLKQNCNNPRTCSIVSIKPTLQP